MLCYGVVRPSEIILKYKAKLFTSILLSDIKKISTNLGIPDFRSKHTGFYSKLLELGYSEPEEIFNIHNFDEDPTYVSTA